MHLWTWELITTENTGSEIKMTKQLKRSIIGILNDVENVEITPEAENMMLEAVKEYTTKIGKEARNISYFMGRKTLRKEDVEFAIERIKLEE